MGASQKMQVHFSASNQPASLDVILRLSCRWDKRLVFTTDRCSFSSLSISSILISPGVKPFSVFLMLSYMLSNCISIGGEVPQAYEETEVQRPPHCGLWYLSYYCLMKV